MTVFGWDASHYDGDLTEAVLRLALAQGVCFFTHKVGEGMSNVDPTGAAALDAARTAGVPVLGGYWFGHDADDPTAEARRFLDRLDAEVPWWREHPHFVLQADCETEAGQGAPSRAWQKTFCDYLAVHSAGKTVGPCRVLDYASHGEYGSIDIGHLMWNANYGSNPHGNFKTIYPGDSSPGWTGYPKAPTFLQYGSNATIAGRTTCDANAYRGTLTQLLALVERTPVTMAHDPLDGDDAATILHSAQLAVGSVSGKQSLAGGVEATRDSAAATLAQAKANGSNLSALVASMTALGSKVTTLAATLDARTTALPAGSLSDVDVQRIAVATADLLDARLKS